MPRGNRLARANAYVSKHAHAGDAYVPLGRECVILQTAWDFQIGALTVAMAASFYQRVVAAPTAAPTGSFIQRAWDDFLEMNVRHDGVRRFTSTDGVFRGTNGLGDAWPLVIYAMCLHVAVKAIATPESCPRRLRHYSFNNLVGHLLCLRFHRDDIGHIESWILRRLRYDILPPLTPSPRGPVTPEPSDDWAPVASP